MNRSYILPAFVLAGLLGQLSGAAAEETTEPTAPALRPNSLLEHMETLADETNRISYAIGVNVARNLKANFPSVNVEFLQLGLADIFEENQLKLNEDYINASIARYNEISTAHVKSQVEGFKNVNLQRAEKWLEQNGKKEDVVTLPSGLQYRVISPGQGPKVKPDGTAIIEYHAKTITGAMVESTLAGERTGPAHVSLGSQPLPFWTEALPRMALGAKWELYIHPKLAHGEKGTERVPPNELLIYQVEIVGMQ